MIHKNSGETEDVLTQTTEPDSIPGSSHGYSDDEEEEEEEEEDNNIDQEKNNAMENMYVIYLFIYLLVI